MLKLGPELFDRLNAEQWVGTQRSVIYGKGGISTHRVDAIERELGFPLPPDFRYLLENVRDPGNILFPWESFSKQDYDSAIDRLFQVFTFDIEHNNLWMKRWGERPDKLEDAIEIARRDYPTWPRLLPMSGHRCLAAEPCLSDNPVFSIMGNDVVYCGANLAHYLLNEFVKHNWQHHTIDQEPRHIDVWSNFAEGDQSQLAWPSGLIGAANAPWAKERS